jgi:hypothetical protein
MRRPSNQQFAAAVAVVMAVSGWISLGRAFPVQGADAAPRPATLRGVGRLPAWLAPGAAFTLSGWAAAEASVRLFAGDRVIGRARSGKLGRFEIDARAPQRGDRYRLRLASGGRRLDVGRLLVRPLVLAAVGDVNLGDRTRDAIASHGSGYLWSGVRPLLQEADLTIANLECAVSAGGAPVPGKPYTFRGSPSTLREVARAGVDVVSLANNHSVDYGRGALLDTVRHARRAGIATVGGGADLAASRRPVRLELGGLRIAVLA